QSGHAGRAQQCLLLGVKRTYGKAKFGGRQQRWVPLLWFGCVPMVWREQVVATRLRPLIRRTSGQAADALNPVFEAPAVSVSVRTRRRSPLHAPLSQIRELQ